MRTLWEIDYELQLAIKEVIENEGEITDELNEILNINQSEFQQKATNYVHLIKGLENDIEVRKAEINRLTAKNKAISKTIESLESNLLRALLLRGGKAEVGDFKLSTRKSKATEINNPDLIPFDYMNVSLSTKLNKPLYDIMLSYFNEEDFSKTPNKTLIKEAINKGEEIEGAEIVENISLTIK